MNKTELIAKIVEKSGDEKLTKVAAEKFLTAYVEAVKEELANGGKVSLVGFGTFKVKESKARTGVNPRTGDSMEIPAKKSPKFDAGKAFKDAVNG